MLMHGGEGEGEGAVDRGFYGGGERELRIPLISFV